MLYAINRQFVQFRIKLAYAKKNSRNLTCTLAFHVKFYLHALLLQLASIVYANNHINKHPHIQTYAHIYCLYTNKTLYMQVSVLLFVGLIQMHYVCM